MSLTKRQFEVQQQQQDAKANYSTLAGHIAAVLAHPDTPVSIYNALGDAVHSLDAPPRYFDSEEYVALCLRLHLKGGDANV